LQIPPVSEKQGPAAMTNKKQENFDQNISMRSGAAHQEIKKIFFPEGEASEKG
jgi:hypothetical protein